MLLRNALTCHNIWLKVCACENSRSIAFAHWLLWTLLDCELNPGILLCIITRSTAGNLTLTPPPTPPNTMWWHDQASWSPKMSEKWVRFSVPRHKQVSVLDLISQTNTIFVWKELEYMIEWPNRGVQWPHTKSLKRDNYRTMQHRACEAGHHPKHWPRRMIWSSTWQVHHGQRQAVLLWGEGLALPCSLLAWSTIYRVSWVCRLCRYPSAHTHTLQIFVERQLHGWGFLSIKSSQWSWATNPWPHESGWHSKTVKSNE